MNRRKFIRNSSLAGFTLPVLLSTGKAETGTMTINESFSNLIEDDELIEVTIDELQQKMQSGKWTSKSITKGYLKRIDDIDKQGPSINSVIELNPDAVDIAEAMDDERKAGKIRGPLHGIPVLIKDNIDTADKMMTTAGSVALVGNKATKDAFIVAQLRNAGAVVLARRI